MKNPYTTLGVDRSADQDSIRKAYKKLARKYHPDINKDPGAEDRFKEINSAYDAVGDENKRKLFDEFGEQSTRPGFDAEAARAWSQGGRGSPFGVGGSGGQGGFPGGVDMEDLLGSLFGAGTSARGPRRGPDQSARVHIDFMTTVLGGEVPLTVQRTGGATETIRVAIPAGAKDGGRIRLRGKGAPPRGGGACGDLLIELSVEAHPLLKRIGDDLELEVPISIFEAMAGGSMTVPTPTGDVKVTIPKGADNGSRLRIKDRGVQRAGRKGHLYLILRPAIPDRDSEEFLLAAQALDEAYDAPPRSKLKL